MFGNKMRRKRWLGILLVVLGVHLILGYVWLTRTQPYVERVSSESDLAVDVRSSPVMQKTEAMDSTEFQQHAAANTKEAVRMGVNHPLSDTASGSKNATKSTSLTEPSTEHLTAQNAQSTVEKGMEKQTEKNQASAIDCRATHKSARAPAGLDAKVWVERTADGRAAFRGLVNQQGETSHYLAEVKQAVQSIRFVVQDEQCVGVKTMLTVRIIQ
ncbi:MAG: hypothetical protein H6R05_25 [Burkholderiaceae bacterium]|nr:hypothetical protein [Burkholderiaceae bacterium]